MKTVHSSITPTQHKTVFDKSCKNLFSLSRGYGIQAEKYCYHDIFVKDRIFVQN